MSDPQNFGLGELGQRVQAMSDPAPDSRLRPYQGAPLPVGTASNGRPISAYEPAASHPTYEEFRISPATASSSAPQFAGQFAPQPASQSAPIPVAASATPPVPPYTPVPQHTMPDPFASVGNTALPGAMPPAAASGASSPASPSTPSAASTQEDPNAPKTGLQRAVNAVRSALPLVQRLLPLLDGNFATAIGALMAPQTGHHPPQPPPQVHVDLEPVERGLAEVRNSNRELRTQLLDQGTSLKRVEDQLERVREATDRNTLEQQELVEDLRSVGTRLSTVAVIGLVLLAISLGLNIYFLVQLQHILR